MSKAFGEQNPTAGETAVSWQTWSDGAAGIPTVSGDTDWGKMQLELTGEEGRSAVYDLGSAKNRQFTIDENRYGTGSQSAIVEIRGSTDSFLQDAVLPAWEVYSAPIVKGYRYVQMRARTEGVTPTYWIVGTGVSLVDARVAPYIGISAGDIIQLEVGTHHPITFQNIIGTALSPITIINHNGLVEFTDIAHENTICFKNCEHLRLTGSGYGGITYGIKLTRYYLIGILGTCKTREIEIDHVKMMESTGDGIGIHMISYGLPGTYVNAFNWDAFDYDGDSNLDADDALDGRYWTMSNVKIHDCHFDGTAAVYNASCSMYLGYSEYTDTPHQRDLYNGGGNLDTGVTVYFPPSSGVEVYDCLFEHTSEKCVQIGACQTGMLVHDNIFSDVCLQLAEKDPAISINPACDGKIYNNKILDCNNGYGIYSYGESMQIYNNVISGVNFYGMVVGARKPLSYHPGDSTWVMNNTVISSYAAACIAFASEAEGANNRIQNNILINTNGIYLDYPAGSFTISNNYQNTNVDNAGFTDHDNDDYTLTGASPCRNAGTNLAAYGVTDDLIGTTRPKGTAYDEGAYEYIE